MLGVLIATLSYSLDMHTHTLANRPTEGLYSNFPSLYHHSLNILNTWLTVLLIYRVVFPSTVCLQGHYRKLRKLVEEATELYQRVAHPMPPRGPTEDEISPTTNDPLLSGSGSDNSEEEGPIPEPKTGNGNQKTTTDALWDKYLPKKSVPTDPPIYTISQHVNSDVTGISTAIEGDIVGSKQVESTYNSQLSTISVEESGTAGTTSSLVLAGGHAGVVPADGCVFTPSTTVFQWNINAAEFIPS